MEQCCKIHDGLQKGVSKRIPALLRGIFIEAKLYGSAKDLFKCISGDDLASQNGVLLILEAISHRDTVSIMAEVLDGFTDISCRRSRKN